MTSADGTAIDVDGVAVDVESNSLAGTSLER